VSPLTQGLNYRSACDNTWWIESSLNCDVILWLLLQRWPEAELHIIDDAGHSAKEPGITTALVNAADKYKHL